MIEDRGYSIEHFKDLSELIIEYIELIETKDIDFLVREMADMMEGVRRHIDWEV